MGEVFGKYFVQNIFTSNLIAFLKKFLPRRHLPAQIQQLKH